MAEEIKDTNVPLTDAQRNEMLRQIDVDLENEKARLSQEAQKPVEKSVDTKTVNVESTPEKVTEPDGKKDSLQQFKDKDGNVDADKIQKSTEHLEKGIREATEEKERLSKMSHEEKVAHLLKVNKEKQKQFTQARQELSQEKKAIEQAPAPVSYAGDLTPEFKTKVLADLDKDPVETMDRLIQARLEQALDRKVKPALADWESDKIRRAERGEAEELAKIANDHPWVMTEGTARFDKVFEERPYLKQSPTKYQDALRFMDDIPSNNGKAAGQAQSGLPILGSSGAVPPPSLDNSAALETSYNALEKEYESAIKARDFKRADECEAKIRMLLKR